MTRPVRNEVPRIDANELCATLERVLSHYFGAPRRLTKLERRPSAYSTSFAIEELGVRLDDGTSLRLLFKDLSREAMLRSARQVKPAFLYDSLREIEVYRVILAPALLSTAICYGAIVDARAGRYGLFLEKISGL